MYLNYISIHIFPLLNYMLSGKYIEYIFTVTCVEHILIIMYIEFNILNI